MAARDDINTDITPQVLLKAYSCGIFPMAESADDPALYWIEPQQRGTLPLDCVHVPKRLARTVRTAEFTVRIDSDFDLVISGCAEPRPGRRSTWINTRIHRLYRDLFDMGRCHTVEVWAGDEIAGGLYGVSLGGAFFGESMFSNMRDAPRSRWFTFAHGWCTAATGCWTLSSSPTTCASSEPSRSTVASSIAASSTHWPWKAISDGCRWTRRQIWYWRRSNATPREP